MRALKLFILAYLLRVALLYVRLKGKGGKED